MRATRKLLDAELARRLDVRGRDKLAIGDYELHRKTRNESVWDGDELETCCVDSSTRAPSTRASSSA
jgi:hypothetical protein